MMQPRGRGNILTAWWREGAGSGGSFRLLLALKVPCSPAGEPEQSQEQTLKAGGASGGWPQSGLLLKSSVLCIMNHDVSITAFC